MPCPPQSDLVAFAQGDVLEELVANFAEHLAECPACSHQLAHLEGAPDELVGELRTLHRAEQAANEPGVADVASRLRGAVWGWRVDSESRAATDAEAFDLRGRHLGEYEVIGPLGRGGMGVVYLTRHGKLKRMAALKIIAAVDGGDSKAIGRFLREMEAVGKLRHPNIVQAYEAGEAEGRHFLAFEYVDGLDLSRIAHAIGPLPVADVCEIGRRVALGLQHAHEHGLVHRDLKPNNVMIDAQGEVRILDLGLARLEATGKNSELTESRQIIGTVDYISPEQARDSRDADVRSDIYSLGCTLYRLLVGHSAFSGPQFDTPLKKLLAHIHEPPRSIRELRREVPGPVVEAIAKMMSKSPSDRHAQPRELADALAPFCKGHDLGALLKKARQAEEANPSADVERSNASTDRSERDATDPKMDRDSGMDERPEGDSEAAAVAALPELATSGRGGRKPRTELWAGLASGFVLLTGIVITVLNRDGQVTYQIEVPDGGETRISVGNALQDPGAEAATEASPDVLTIVGNPELLRREPGKPIGPVSLVANPGELAGVVSWSLERKLPIGAVWDAAYNPAGSLIASAGDDRLVRLWDSQSGELLRVLPGHEHGITNLDWSPDGQYLATRDTNGQLIVWRVDSATPLYAIDTFDDAGSQGFFVRWSPDGNWLVTAASQTITVRDAKTGEISHELPAVAVGNVSFPEHGSLMAVSKDGPTSLEVWDLTYRKCMAAAELGALQSLVFSPDGTRVFGRSVGHNSSGKLIAWSFENETVVWEHGPRTDHSANRPRGCSWNAAGTHLAVIGGSHLSKFEVWDAESFASWRTYSYEGNVSSVDFSPDGKRVVAGNDKGGIAVFDVESGRRLMDLSPTVTQQRLRDVLVAEPKPELITLEYAPDQQVRRWGPTGPLTVGPESVGWGGPVVARGSKLHWVAGEPAHWMEYDFDAHEMRYLKVLEGIYAEHIRVVRRTELSPDGSRVAVYTDGGLQVFALDSGKPLLSVRLADGSQPRGLGWSHNGAYLAASDSSGRCTIYDGKNLQVVREVMGIRDADIAWNRHIPLLATGDGQLIDYTGKQDRKLPFSCDRLAWSEADASRLAIFSLGTTELRDWDVKLEVENPPFRQWPTTSNSVHYLGDNVLTADSLRDAIWVYNPRVVWHSVLFLMPENKHAIVDANGRYRGDVDLDDQFVNVVLTETGYETLKPSEFQASYGWKNRPDEVRLW